MIRVIVGTAGHVDHGKTSLVLALTGVDCDRWAEEKSRGITIDLGFAHLTEGDVQLGFVDVPGHERFLHNALAGLGGIRIAMLVVAADERIRAQTREHVAICALLKIPTLVVALTKSDLVTDEQLQLAQLEVEDFLAASSFAGAPVVPVSSRTGDGLTLLKLTLCAHARQLDAESSSRQPARLPIDRAFYLKGLGLIATGTLIGGVIRPGDSLELLPARRACRVRNVHVHGRPRECAVAGERVSVQLNALDLADVQRGMQLVESHLFEPMTHALAMVTTLPDMPPATDSCVWRLYLHSADIVCRVRRLDRAALRPGETSLVEIVPKAPLVAVRGDRFVLRHSAARMTVAGGVVLTPFAQSHRRTRNRIPPPPPEAVSADVLLTWIEESGLAGVSTVDLAARLGRRPSSVEEELRTLMEAHRIDVLTSATGSGHAARWISRTISTGVRERVREILEEHDRTDDLGQGLTKGYLLAALFPGISAEIAGLHLSRLEAENVIAIDRNRVIFPGRRILKPDECSLATAVLDHFQSAGLRPRSTEQLGADLNVASAALESVLLHLEARGRLVRMSQNVLCGTTAVSRLCNELCASNWERFTVPQFKDQFGLTRKWAIPLLEYLDSIGITQRIGDERRVVRA